MDAVIIEFLCQSRVFTTFHWFLNLPDNAVSMDRNALIQVPPCTFSNLRLQIEVWQVERTENLLWFEENVFGVDFLV